MSIAFEQVGYSYISSSDASANVWALADLDLEIASGSFTSVIGHTGSGKSTLIQHVNGLLRPTRGRVLVDGLDTASARDRKQIRRKVGIVFQYPEYQLFGNTVAQDVGFGPRNMGLSEGEVVERVNRSLEQVGLDPEAIRERSPFDFSGGQKRRIAIAGVLAMDPEYLVLDEPMAGLDPHGRHEIMGYITHLHDEGMTVVMVTHSMDDVADFSDDVVILKDGRLFMHDVPERVFQHAAELREIGLTIPVTTRMALELSECGFEFSKTCFSVDELADAIALQLGGVALNREEGRVYG